jgi:hypothetical protein
LASRVPERIQPAIHSGTRQQTALPAETMQRHRIWSVTVAVRVRPSAVPVTVTGNVPDVVSATMVSVAAVQGGTVLGLKLPRVLPGKPLTLKLTALVKPPDGETVTENVVVPFRAILRDAGVTIRVKSPTAAGDAVGVGVDVAVGAGVGVAVAAGGAAPLWLTETASIHTEPAAWAKLKLIAAVTLVVGVNV